MTPVPSRILRVRSAAAAMNTSGDAMISQPALWCSPIHASSYPSVSSHWIVSRSRSKERVGFSPFQWNGAIKIPNFMRSGSVILQSFALLGVRVAVS